MDDLHETAGWLPAQISSHPSLIAGRQPGTRNSGAKNGRPRTFKEAIHDHEQSGNPRAGPS